MRDLRLCNQKTTDYGDNIKEIDTCQDCPSLIQLHYEDDTVIGESTMGKAQPERHARGWTGKVTLTDPEDNEIAIGSTAPLGHLLTRLASCHD